MINLSQDIHPLTDFKRDTSGFSIGTRRLKPFGSASQQPGKAASNPPGRR